MNKLNKWQQICAKCGKRPVDPEDAKKGHDCCKECISEIDFYIPYVGNIGKDKHSKSL